MGASKKGKGVHGLASEGMGYWERKQKFGLAWFPWCILVSNMSLSGVLVTKSNKHWFVLVDPVCWYLKWGARKRRGPG
jgi:hypothetical protein